MSANCSCIIQVDFGSGMVDFDVGMVDFDLGMVDFGMGMVDFGLETVEGFSGAQAPRSIDSCGHTAARVHESPFCSF